MLALRVATIPSDSGSDVYYARDQGFFKAAGLNVEIDTISSGPAIIGAVSGGSYDIGAGNTVSIAAARERGIPIKMIAPGALHSTSAPTDLLMVEQKSSFRSGRDLNGKTIAVSTLSGLNALSVQAWITKSGGDLSTIRFIEVPFPAMAAALDQGRVDAAEMAEPFVTANKDSLRVLADANNAIGEHFLIDAWVASDSWLLQHADAAKRFAAALHDAHVWANAHHEESAVILVRYLKMPLGVVNAMTRASFGTALDPLLVEPLLNTAAKYGQLEHPLSAVDVIWSPRT